MPSGNFGEWMTPAADAAWRSANRASVELGHSWLGTEHLLLGLLAGPPNDPAVAALTAAGVTGGAVREALTRDLAAGGGREDRALLATLGIDLDVVRARVDAVFGPDAIDSLYARRRLGGRRLTRGPLCGLGIAPRAKRALERARRRAKAAHRTRFDGADLLFGLLEIDDGMAVRLLRDLGVDPAAVSARLHPRAA
jgi:ATP-dependent Clp protease ATP-binding subunit ClpA